MSVRLSVHFIQRCQLRRLYSFSDECVSVQQRWNDADREKKPVSMPLYVLEVKHRLGFDRGRLPEHSCLEQRGLWGQI
jgi:hypothetical protein